MLESQTLKIKSSSVNRCVHYSVVMSVKIVTAENAKSAMQIAKQNIEL